MHKEISTQEYFISLTMQRSAYFDDLDSASSDVRVQSFDSSAARGSRECDAYSQNKPTQFPISRRILWDREPTDSPRFIRSVGKGNFDKPAKIVALSDLSEHDRAALTLASPMRSMLGGSSFVVQIAEDEGSSNQHSSSSDTDVKVTIPVSARPLSDTTLAFDAGQR